MVLYLHGESNWFYIYMVSQNGLVGNMVSELSQ